MINYSIETMHGDEICSGIQSKSAAKEAAQRHANRFNSPVWLASSDGDSEEVVPDTDD